MKRTKLKMALLTTLTAIVFNNIDLHAQSQFAGWLATFNTFKTGKKTSIHNDIQWRSTDNITHMQTFLFRAGLNVSVRKNMIVTGGYAYISNRRVIGSVSGYAPEHRIWEQLIVNQKISKLSLAHRFRLEQRFISKTAVENNNIVNDGSVFANRLRYFVRSVLPLQKSTGFSRGAFLALQNEIFLNIGNKANVNGELFDQNRLYLAAGYRLSPKLDLETGYMWQSINGRGDVTTQVNIWQAAAYVRL